jgi:hypothetical protein
MGRGFLAVIAFLIMVPAFAQEPAGCDKFKWPLDREHALLASAASAKSGDEVPSTLGSAVKLALAPLADAHLPMAPERAPRSTSSYAGYVRLSGVSQPGHFGQLAWHFKRVRLIWFEGLGCDCLLVQAASLVDGFSFDALPSFENSRPSAEVDVGRREVVQPLVVSVFVIVLDELLNIQSNQRAVGTRLTAAHCQAASHDRRVPAAHDTEVGDGARRFGVGQCQRKPGSIGQFPASVWDALAHLFGDRGQSEQGQSYCCECARHGWRHFLPSSNSRK